MNQTKINEISNIKLLEILLEIQEHQKMFEYNLAHQTKRYSDYMNNKKCQNSTELRHFFL